MKLFKENVFLKKSLILHIIFCVANFAEILMQGMKHFRKNAKKNVLIKISTNKELVNDRQFTVLQILRLHSDISIPDLVTILLTPYYYLIGSTEVVFFKNTRITTNIITLSINFNKKSVV